MKQIITDLIAQALLELARASQIPAELSANIQVTPSRDASQGDYASNIALMLARPTGMLPRALAELIVGTLPPLDTIEKIEVAGPGFINFFVTSSTSHSVVHRILEQGDNFGRSESGQGRKIQVEFVSANPTGPLHVGHGRGAAIGATLANLLSYVGYEVQKEYYVNDAGRQMHILAVSVWLRYLDLCGESITFPSNGYQGDYVWDIAATLHRENAERFHQPATLVFADVCEDAPSGNKERHVDDLIANAQGLLGEDEYRFVFDLGLVTLVEVIRADLQAR